jgi:DNA-binding transcriptional regulator YdaS (Cro superfamily)
MKTSFAETKYFKKSKNALLRAIRLSISQKNLAGKCSATQQEISDWLKKGIPPTRVISVEKAVNGAVTRHELRPDIYPLD